MPSIPRAVNLLAAKARHARDNAYRELMVSITELAMMNFSVEQRKEVARKATDQVDDNHVRITYVSANEEFKIRISNS